MLCWDDITYRVSGSGGGAGVEWNCDCDDPGAYRGKTHQARSCGFVNCVTRPLQRLMRTLQVSEGIPAPMWLRLSVILAQGRDSRATGESVLEKRTTT